MSRRFIKLITTIFVLAAFSWPVIAADSIKIGAVLTTSGPAGYAGDPEAKTLKIEVEEINKSGGILGRQIDLVIYDDAGDPSKARTFATRLLEDDKVSAVIGGSLTGTTLAMAPVLEEANVPMISLAGAIQIVSPTRPYVFKTPHTDRMACQKIFEHMSSQGIKSIGILAGNGGFSKSMHAQCLEVAGDYGITILVDEGYGAADADMTPQMNKLKNTDGVQAILNPGMGAGPVIVARNYQQLAMTVPLYIAHSMASKKFIDLAGKDANSIRLPSPALVVPDKIPADAPQKKPISLYKDRYEAAYSEPVSTFGGYAFDAIHILVNAIKAAGTTEGPAIRDAIERTENYIGVTGIYNMSADDHMGLDTNSFVILEVQNEDWTLKE